jgi:hypothetical protein
MNMTDFSDANGIIDNDDFEELYRQLVSHLRTNRELDDPSMQGKILADFHFFTMLDQSYPSALSERQRTAVDHYCADIGRVAVDFTKQSFFKKCFPH